MVVRDIMGKELYSASPATCVRDVAQIMLRHNIGSVPVVEGERLLGIITDRDLAIECCTANVDIQKTPVSDFMTTNPITVKPDASLEEACELMARYQIRRLPVAEGGKLLGIISLGDLAVTMPQNQAVLNALNRISVPCRVPQQAFTGGQAAAGAY